MGVTGRLAAGELGGQRPPDGYGRVEFLLGQETLADLKEDSWHSWVERILSDELAPSRARLGISSPVQMVGGDQKLSVENGALGIGALGTVGKGGQVSLPGGDGLVELLLPLEDLGVRKGCRRSMSRTRSAQVRRAERD